MSRVRKRMKCICRIFAGVFLIATALFLATGLKPALTDEAFSLFSWISMWVMLASNVLFFIAFFIVEALPKDELNFKETKRGKMEDSAASSSTALIFDFSKNALKKDLEKTSNPIKKRAGWINDYLKRYIGNDFLIWPVSKIFVLESRKGGLKATRSYLLVFGKRYKYVKGIGHEEYPLEERIAFFDRFLKEILLDGESLHYKNEAFCIEAENYELCYYIEAYRKNTDKKCYIDQGKPKAERLYGNGAAQAFYELKCEFGSSSAIIGEVFKAMNDESYALTRPNARERFVALCKEKNHGIS